MTVDCSEFINRLHGPTERLQILSYEESRVAGLCYAGRPLAKVLLEGEWVKPSEVGMVSSIETRRFQGFGKTTREGRMRAAEAALAKLRGLMPGLEVPTGDLPTEWER